VARNTVREALRSLTHLGVLEARAGDGTYVRIGTELAAVLHRGMATTDPEEVLELRGLLEQHAVGQAAQRRTESELGEIQKLMLEVRRVSRGADHAAHAAADGAFHLAVVRIGGNDFLTQMYEQVTAAFGEFLSGCDIDAETQDEQDAWHEKLFTAIEDGDAEGARKAAATIVDINRRCLQEQRK
jgi:DNA-binding FadR family transcriptional regulator